MAQKKLVKRSRQSFTRLARFFNQLMREQLGCGPVTVQQCYTLEALADGPLSMKDLAGEVALHQSTLTRVVEKLEKQNLVQRTRKSDNQRSVEVRLTDAGKQTYAFFAQLQLFSSNSHFLLTSFLTSCIRFPRCPLGLNRESRVIRERSRRCNRGRNLQLPLLGSNQVGRCKE